MTDLPDFLPADREPDFDNLLAVLRRERPSRPTLFEFFLNPTLHRMLAPDVPTADPALAPHVQRFLAFRNAGYDACTFLMPDFQFTYGERDVGASVSLNAGTVIHDRADFEAYAWPDPDAFDIGLLDRLAPYVPRGMKLIPHGPDGVEENVIELIGYENLCYMLADDPELVGDVFDAVGSRLVRYYERLAPHPLVGACISNDDWGFKTQSLLSVDQMRQFVFPWHRRIIAAIHDAGKPAILHSCGYFEHYIDDLLALGYDARHSYEDAILPVEEAYDRFHGDFAVLGGIDVDFVCRAAPEDVYKRSRAMLERAGVHGGYALGTGNSVPEYVPPAGYFAMIRAALT